MISFKKQKVCRTKPYLFCISFRRMIAALIYGRQLLVKLQNSSKCSVRAFGLTSQKLQHNVSAQAILFAVLVKRTNLCRFISVVNVFEMADEFII